MDKQKRALYYYLANQEEINEGHLGEYVGIYDNHIIGYYKDRFQGVMDMVHKGYERGTFNVSLCRPSGEPEVFMGFIPVTGEDVWI
ncbi:MAG: hypothetical protein LBM77_01995 [Spirochaetaceae bacterium]|nr:hypothetical protein [Spirochaetaceae bacterium]